jgi:tetratricopeptide (TPR) repeat protein
MLKVTFVLPVLLLLNTGLSGFGPPETNPLAITDEMKSYLDTRFSPWIGRKQELEMLVASLFQTDGLDFSYQSVTRTAASTFSEGGGNCLSFANMIVAMARHLGFRANFQEVLLAPVWSRRGHVITLSRHVNVAVLLGGASYVVDLLPELQQVQLGTRIISDDRARAHFYNNKGTEYMAEFRFEEAKSCFEKAVELDPGASFSWINLGVVLAHVKDFHEAERCYRLAIKRGNDTDQAVAMHNLAKLYEESGRKHEAARYAEKVKRFREQNPYFHFSLGQEALKSGEIRVSITHFNAALERKSKEPIFHYALAEAYLELAQTSTAINHLRIAAELAEGTEREDFYSEKLNDLIASQSEL